MATQTSDVDSSAKHWKPLGRLPGSYRLVLEMSLHEADERRALAGEMAELEARWREAEAIAGIADSMFLPADVDDRLTRMRSKSSCLNLMTCSDST